MTRRAPSRRSASVVLATALTCATAAPLLVPSAVAAGETTSPAEQDISAFCTNAFPSSFSDLPPGHTFELAIRCLATAGITRGGPEDLQQDQYGAERAVRRGQMASFVANMLDAADARDRNLSDNGFSGQIQQLPAWDGGNAFSDVPSEDVHAAAINRLASVGVVTGGAAGGAESEFRPNDPVSRAQMASFINRAVAFAQGDDPAMAGEGSGYSAPEDADYYTDDEQVQAHGLNIEGITSVGIAVGDGQQSYHPSGTITRGQMAGFVARTLAQLFDDVRVNALLEVFSGHFAPGARTEEQRQVGPQDGDVSVTMYVRDVHAGFLDREAEYRITLVKCENVSRDGGLLAVTPDGDTGLADAGAPGTRIVAVGDTEEQHAPPEGTTNSVAARPGPNGTLRIDIRNDEGPECVTALLYLNGGPGSGAANGGESPRLEVSDDGRPKEFFGVSGSTTFVASS